MNTTLEMVVVRTVRADGEVTEGGLSAQATLERMHRGRTALRVSELARLRDADPAVYAARFRRSCLPAGTTMEDLARHETAQELMVEALGGDLGDDR